MKACFADTYFYLALLNPKDDAYEAVLRLNRELTMPMVTTAWILTEVGDALAAPAHRPIFLELLSVLQGDPEVVIVPPCQELFDRGVEFFGHRLDQRWSLTDCISFVVMEERGIHDALTGDHHFEQAGFHALLK
ncbi:MAG: type II toxin-antitoxin system VapC family toxin [Phycisphaerae bacterium]|nr:type II toxin-antitoxin system VapC family toxin [Phycisphaerae bacterium]